MKQIGYPISTQHFEGRMEKAFCIKQYLLKVSKLMNKDLAQNKVFNCNYFNIGDAETLVKLKEK